VKRLNSILFAVLLVWAQFAPATVITTCGQATTIGCRITCDGHMACCAAKPSDNSESSPATPPPASVQNEISLFAPAIVTWILPSQPASLVSSVNVLPLVANGTPLFTRHCVFLI
jgi:hypothetical protein